MVRRRSPRRDQAPGWLWLLGGFALGLLVALGVYVGRQPAPGAARLQPLPPAPTTAPTPVPATAVPERDREAPPAEEPESRFEFYDLLPQFEVVVPEVESQTELGPPPAEVEEPGRYVIQVGSFTQAADAERMRANLGLLGIQSRLQRVAIDDQVFHRVRIGPLSDLAEINRIRNQLTTQRIDSLLMRAPED